jgi:hypothetical protein
MELNINRIVFINPVESTQSESTENKSLSDITLKFILIPKTTRGSVQQEKNMLS